jgi:hypothetical protein
MFLAGGIKYYFIFINMKTLTLTVVWLLLVNTGYCQSDTSKRSFQVKQGIDTSDYITFSKLCSLHITYIQFNKKGYAVFYSGTFVDGGALLQNTLQKLNGSDSVIVHQFIKIITNSLIDTLFTYHDLGLGKCGYITKVSPNKYAITQSNVSDDDLINNPGLALKINTLAKLLDGLDKKYSH